MLYLEEPPRPHGQQPRTAVVVVNLGTPDTPTARDVRRYLKEFLGDQRVVELPKLIWWPILNGLILPKRAHKSAKKYQSVWMKEGSPLKVYTERQVSLLQDVFKQRGIDAQVVMAMRYGKPALPDVLAHLKAEGVDRILVFPCYPQYSGTTTASVIDAVTGYYSKVRNIPEWRFVRDYYDHPAYIAALRSRVAAYWAQHGTPDKLVMSFHGIPKRVCEQGDTYYDECQETARLLGEALGLTPAQYLVTFQSRFGKLEWLKPYTDDTLEDLAEAGVARVDVVCPGFVSDCLETLEEIGMEGREEFLEEGGKEFHVIPCLNDAPEWIDAMATIVAGHMAPWQASQDVTVAHAEIL